jgi:hypothetical protein
MAVAASGLFALGVVGLFGFLVVFVVALLTLLSQVFNVPVVKRSVESHGLARRNQVRATQVTVPADRRAGLQSRVRRFVVTSHTLEVVNVHDRVPVLVRESKELLREASVLETWMTGLAVLVSFSERLRVLIVREGDHRSFDLTEHLQTVEGDDVGSIGDLFR